MPKEVRNELKILAVRLSRSMNDLIAVAVEDLILIRKRGSGR
jgi:hypothetical protein